MDRLLKSMAIFFILIGLAGCATASKRKQINQENNIAILNHIIHAQPPENVGGLLEETLLGSEWELWEVPWTKVSAGVYRLPHYLLIKTKDERMFFEDHEVYRQKIVQTPIALGGGLVPDNVSVQKINLPSHIKGAKKLDKTQAQKIKKSFSDQNIRGSRIWTKDYFDKELKFEELIQKGVVSKVDNKPDFFYLNDFKGSLDEYNKIWEQAGLKNRDTIYCFYALSNKGR